MDSHEFPARVPPITSAARTTRESLRATARDGDLLVARESVSGRYTIRQVPAAVQVARRFAQMHRVDIWYQDKSAVRLLEVYRVASDPRPTRSNAEG